MSNEPFSVAELMACRLAAEFRNGEIVVVGGASVLPMAAVLLAQRTRAPDLTVVTGSGAVNPDPGQLYPSGADHHYLNSCEARLTIEDVFDHTEKGVFDVICLGGFQVDRTGAVNLTMIPGEGSAPAFRGPGLVNVGVTATVDRVLLCMTRHDPRTFVKQVDHVSSAGNGAARKANRMAGRLGVGPSFCITPLACFGFTQGQMVLESLHPGVEVATVEERTGFEVSGLDDWFRTGSPEPEQLKILRGVVDRSGMLNREGVIS